MNEKTERHHRIFDVKKTLLTAGETGTLVGCKKSQVIKNGIPSTTVYTDDMALTREMFKTSDVKKFVIDRRAAAEKRKAQEAVEREKNRKAKEESKKQAADAAKDAPAKDAPKKNRARKFQSGSGPVVLTSKEVAKIIGAHVTTVCEWGREGNGPIKPAFCKDRGEKKSYFWRFNDVLNMGR